MPPLLLEKVLVPRILVAALNKFKEKLLTSKILNFAILKLFVFFSFPFLLKMSANSSTEAQPKRQLDWYDNIENIRPVRGGHSAASVMAAASAPPLTVTEAREKFHNSLKEAGSACDPLAVLISFIKWFDDHFLSGKVSVLHPMLYQILTKYGTEPRYRNDERIMKLWLRLADNFPERGFAVMQLACSRGSCRELAKFYIFWSKMYEYAGEFLIQIFRESLCFKNKWTGRAKSLQEVYTIVLHQYLIFMKLPMHLNFESVAGQWKNKKRRKTVISVMMMI